MRAIKFRGKAHGRWVYGGLVYSDNIEPAIYFEVGNKVCRMEWAYVDPATVGQFTGMLDKNGHEIYEGDIVSHPWKDPIFGDLVETGQFVHSTICFNNGAFVVNYRLQGEYIYLQDFVRLKCLEVIGNIHDNPELLKGGEK